MNKDQILEKYGKDSYQVDEDTFHMGIHQKLSDHVAKRFKKYHTVLDACAGAGFMTMAITRYASKVIAIDIDETHLNQAKANAEIDSVDSKITFIKGNVLDEIKKFDILEAAFLDPDWARPGDNKTIHVHELSDMEPSGEILFNEVSKKTKNICLRLPKEFNLSKLKDLPIHESEAFYQDGKIKLYCAYFVDLMLKEERTEFKV